MNKTYKVIGRIRPKEQRAPWMEYGITGRIAKKRIYTSKPDFEKYAPDTIRRYKRYYDTEAFELIDEKWVPIDISEV